MRNGEPAKIAYKTPEPTLTKTLVLAKGLSDPGSVIYKLSIDIVQLILSCPEVLVCCGGTPLMKGHVVTREEVKYHQDQRGWVDNCYGYPCTKIYEVYDRCRAPTVFEVKESNANGVVLSRGDLDPKMMNSKWKNRSDTVGNVSWRYEQGEQNEDADLAGRWVDDMEVARRRFGVGARVRESETRAVQQSGRIVEVDEIVERADGYIGGLGPLGFLNQTFRVKVRWESGVDESWCDFRTLRNISSEIVLATHISRFFKAGYLTLGFSQEIPTEATKRDRVQVLTKSFEGRTLGLVDQALVTFYRRQAAGLPESIQLRPMWRPSTAVVTTEAEWQRVREAL